MVGEHVHLVNHIDLEARIRRCVHRLLQQLRHFIDAAIGRGIHLYIVNETTGINRHAGFTHTARCRRDAAIAVGTDAIEGFG
ncbi:hypothetical protein D3C81_2049720 [compost metagenome]